MLHTESFTGMLLTFITLLMIILGPPYYAKKYWYWYHNLCDRCEFSHPELHAYDYKGPLNHPPVVFLALFWPLLEFGEKYLEPLIDKLREKFNVFYLNYIWQYV